MMDNKHSFPSKYSFFAGTTVRTYKVCFHKFLISEPFPWLNLNGFNLILASLSFSSCAGLECKCVLLLLTKAPIRLEQVYCVVYFLNVFTVILNICSLFIVRVVIIFLLLSQYLFVSTFFYMGFVINICIFFFMCQHATSFTRDCLIFVM